MVSGGNPARAGRLHAGVVTIELVVAIGLLAAALLPLAYSFGQEQKLMRAYYFRAIATELVDGEMEILAAGEWRHFPPGRQPYSIQAEAATNLPPGQLFLTVQPSRLRLEWQPGKRGLGGAVVREIELPAASVNPVKESSR
jgi:hypothetical protein